jgi:hypothetical protein
MPSVVEADVAPSGSGPATSGSGPATSAEELELGEVIPRALGTDLDDVTRNLGRASDEPGELGTRSHAAPARRQSGPERVGDQHDLRLPADRAVDGGRGTNAPGRA